MLYRHGLGGLFAVLLGSRTELLAMMRLVNAACIVFALGMGQARADLLINANGQGWINNGNHGSNGDSNSNNYTLAAAGL